jgi:hypothetical protein
MRLFFVVLIKRAFSLKFVFLIFESTFPILSLSYTYTHNMNFSHSHFHTHTLSLALILLFWLHLLVCSQSLMQRKCVFWKTKLLFSNWTANRRDKFNSRLQIGKIIFRKIKTFLSFSFLFLFLFSFSLSVSLLLSLTLSLYIARCTLFICLHNTLNVLIITGHWSL